MNNNQIFKVLFKKRQVIDTIDLYKQTYIIINVDKIDVFIIFIFLLILLIDFLKMNTTIINT